MLVDLDSAPGFSDESVRVYLATGLTEVGRPEAHDEEADMTLQWYPLAEAVRQVLSGEIVNAIAVAGILAAHAVTTGFARAAPGGQPVDRQADGVRGAKGRAVTAWPWRHNCRATSTT